MSALKSIWNSRAVAFYTGRNETSLQRMWVLFAFLVVTLVFFGVQAYIFAYISKDFFNPIFYFAMTVVFILSIQIPLLFRIGWLFDSVCNQDIKQR